MAHHYLVPADPLVQSFVLYSLDSEGKRTLRDEFRPMACSSCGRLDELAAVGQCERVDTIKIPHKKDFCATFDWFLCVSDRFRTTVEENGISGVSFVPLSKSPGHSILVPQQVETDASKSQMKFIGVPCASCGRHRESVHLPALQSMNIPDEPKSMFMPSLRPEKNTGRMCVLVASEQVVDILKAAELSGIDWRASQ